MNSGIEAQLALMNAQAEIDAYAEDEGLGLYMSVENAGRSISYAQSEGHKYYMKGVPFFLQWVAPITADKWCGDWHYELRPTLRTRIDWWLHPHKRLEREERIESAKRAYRTAEERLNAHRKKEREKHGDV